MGGGRERERSLLEISTPHGSEAGPRNNGSGMAAQGSALWAWGEGSVRAVEQSRSWLEGGRGGGREEEQEPPQPHGLAGEGGRGPDLRREFCL